MPDINDFLQIAIVGAALSLAVQVIKSKWPMSSAQAKFVTLGLSVVAGGAFWFLKDTNMWQAAMGTLGSASAVYGLLLKKGDE